MATGKPIVAYLARLVNVRYSSSAFTMCIVIGHTVGGIKTVTFPSRPVPFKRKRVPVPFNKKKMGTEREVEQATNGATNFVNRS